MYVNLTTLSLSRNYLRGSTGALKEADALETLVLSSNYFSCDAVDLDGASRLAEGRFQDPGARALRGAGLALAEGFPFINPFAAVRNITYTNLALVYTGNSQLTTQASVAESVPAGNLLVKDMVKLGRRPLFSGDAAPKQLLFITLPALLTFYAATIGIALSTSGRGLQSYFSFAFESDCPDAVSRLYSATLRMFPVFTGIALGLAVLNLVSPVIFDCTSAIGWATLSSTEVGSVYQWCWVALNCASLVVGAVLAHRVDERNRVKRASSVHGTRMQAA